MILEANHSMHKYFISHSDPVTLKSETRWLKVDDVTSVTKEEENDRQQKAESDSGRRNDTCTGHEADSPGQPVKQARTDNASLLEASIDQMFSSEKLDGDTVNLYFDFLRNNRALGLGVGKFVLLSFIASTAWESKDYVLSPPPNPTVHSNYNSNMAGQIIDGEPVTLARPNKTPALQAIWCFA